MTLSNRIIAPCALLLCLLAGGGATASTVGFSLSVNDPVVNAANGNLNVPDIRLENTSTNGSRITDLTLTIGDENYNFDFVRLETIMVDPGNDLGFTLNTVFYTNDHVGEDVLSYSFQGFDPGDVFFFEVDVDPDNGNPGIDFRAALFPNATMTLGFSNGSVLTEPFDPVATAGNSFQFGASATVVPLPGGLSLLLGALVGISLVRRRRTAHSGAISRVARSH